jgi:uncharacterized membrane protein YphA (DoxX/SURF4 family)
MAIPKSNTTIVSWLLRAALALVFLYASVSSFLSPQDWVGYFPQLLRDIVPDTILLPFFSVYELALAVWLLSGWLTKYAALLAIATLGGIVAANFQLFLITFRDMALMLAALALFFLEKDKEK